MNKVFKVVDNKTVSVCDNHVILKEVKVQNVPRHHITYHCKIHNNEKSTVRYILTKRGCSSCNMYDRREKAKLKFFTEFGKSKQAKDFIISYDEYNTSEVLATSFKVKHLLCERTFDIGKTAFLKNPTCKHCQLENQKVKSKELLLEKYKSTLNHEEFDIIKFPESSSDTITLKHKNCGRVFERSTSFIEGYNIYCECTNLFNDYTSNFKDAYLNKGFELLGVKGLDDDKITALSKIKLKHLFCGRTFTQRHDTFNKSYGCKHCNNEAPISRLHAIVWSILECNGVDYDSEYRFDDCKSKQPLPFDFRINLSEGSFILIEVDGQQHYRKTLSGIFKETQESIWRNDEIKNNYCNSNNIQLYRMRVDDFKTISVTFKYLKSIIPDLEIKPKRSDVDSLHKPKITSGIAEDIRVQYTKGKTREELSHIYNVHTSTITKTVKYQNYPDLRLDLKDEILALNHDIRYPARNNESKLIGTNPIPDHTITKCGVYSGLTSYQMEIYCDISKKSYITNKKFESCKFCNTKNRHDNLMAKISYDGHNIIRLGTYDDLKSGYLEHECSKSGLKIKQTRYSFETKGCDHCNGILYEKKEYFNRNCDPSSHTIQEDVDSSKWKVDCQVHNHTHIQNKSTFINNGCAKCNSESKKLSISTVNHQVINYGVRDGLPEGGYIEVLCEKNDIKYVEKYKYLKYHGCTKCGEENILGDLRNG